MLCPNQAQHGALRIVHATGLALNLCYNARHESP
jgi:hypothetical protein